MSTLSIKQFCAEGRFLLEANPNIEICFSQKVLKHFYKNRQIKTSSKETGGQLFAKIQNGIIYVYCASGPRKFDHRGRFFFKPLRWREQFEIRNKFKQGLHYVGDWHTHPQKHPLPSTLDIKSMRECFASSKHELPFFILVIVGQTPSPTGISVSIHNDSSHLFLTISNRP